MKVRFSKKFDKSIDTLKNEKLKGEISTAVRSVINAKSVHDIPNLKKLKGHKTAYRIRTGSYRIGVYIENDTVEFAAFAHRKDIYNLFP